MQDAGSPVHGVVEPVLVVAAVAVAVGVDMDGDGAARLDVQALQVGLLAELVVVLLDADGVVREDAVGDASQDCNTQSPSLSRCALAVHVMHIGAHTWRSQKGNLTRKLHLSCLHAHGQRGQPRKALSIDLRILRDI